MYFVRDPENPGTDSNAMNQAELHLSTGDIITVVMPQGGEVYLYQAECGLEIQDSSPSMTMRYRDC